MANPTPVRDVSPPPRPSRGGQTFVRAKVGRRARVRSGGIGEHRLAEVGVDGSPGIDGLAALVRDHRAAGVRPRSHQHRVTVAGSVDRGLDGGKLVRRHQGATWRGRRRGAPALATVTTTGALTVRLPAASAATAVSENWPSSTLVVSHALGQRRDRVGAERLAVLLEGDGHHANLATPSVSEVFFSLSVKDWIYFNH